MKIQRPSIRRNHIVLCLAVLSVGIPALAGAAEAAAEAESWVYDFLGHLHPMTVHFPIALLIVALMMECILWVRPSAPLRSGTVFVLVIAALSAIAAALFGWYLGDPLEYDETTLFRHRWSGVSVAALSTLAAISMLISGKGKNAVLVRIHRSLLILSVAAVSVAGHFGGVLTHGNNYLARTLPWVRNAKPAAPPVVPAEETPVPSQGAPDGGIDFVTQVQPILAASCVKCHGATKQKGQLRLDQKEFAMKGSKNGPAILPGNAANSKLIQLVSLPPDDLDIMPSEGDPLTAEQIALLSDWINKGAEWPESAVIAGPEGG